MLAALAGTLKDQPRSALVMTDSPCSHEVLMACVMFTKPHPSWLLGAASPAPLVLEEYWPSMSWALAMKMALMRAEVGAVSPSLSMRCCSNKAVAPAVSGVAMLVPPM